MDRTGRFNRELGISSVQLLLNNQISDQIGKDRIKSERTEKIVKTWNWKNRRIKAFFRTSKSSMESSLRMAAPLINYNNKKESTLHLLVLWLRGGAKKHKTKGNSLLFSNTQKKKRKKKVEKDTKRRRLSSLFSKSIRWMILERCRGGEKEYPNTEGCLDKN